MANKSLFGLSFLFLSAVVLLAGCAAPAPSAGKNQTVTPQRPPIDMKAPSAIETATFALG